MTVLRPFPEGIDFYGKDASKATRGVDNVFRIYCNKDGFPCRVVSLSPAEVEAYRDAGKKKP